MHPQNTSTCTSGSWLNCQKAEEFQSVLKKPLHLYTVNLTAAVRSHGCKLYRPQVDRKRFIEYTLFLYFLSFQYDLVFKRFYSLHILRFVVILCSGFGRREVRNSAALFQPRQGWNCFWERCYCGGDSEEPGRMVVYQVSLGSLASDIC